MRSTTLARPTVFSSLALLLPLAAAYWFVAASLAAQWADDPNYAHGFLVIPMAAVLAWRRRERFLAAPSRSDPLGFWMVTAGGILYLLGVLAAELFTMRASLVVVLAGVLVALEGRRRARVMVFPLLFLLAMVPLPYVFYYRLTFPLQLESSRLAAGLLSALGMPLVREGNMIHLEGYSLEVVTACSGLRSIMTLGTMALFVVDFLRLSTPMRVLFLLGVVPIAVAANVARLSITAGIAAIGGREAAESFLHELSGLVVFVVGLFVLLAYGKGLAWAGRARR